MPETIFLQFYLFETHWLNPNLIQIVSKSTFRQSFFVQSSHTFDTTIVSLWMNGSQPHQLKSPVSFEAIAYNFILFVLWFLTLIFSWRSEQKISKKSKGLVIAKVVCSFAFIRMVRSGKSLWKGSQWIFTECLFETCCI